MTDGPRAARVADLEAAAHEDRTWVRLTYACNNRCRFCLDADNHDGELRPVADLTAEIEAGRRRGATRLVLSGGEPTIHPRFVELVQAGARAGFRRIQVVSNGRMFFYRSFLERALDAGLSEITFSVHGPDAGTHDALVGVPGAYDQTLGGLRRALADGRPVVNVDVCVNRLNAPHLAETLRRCAAVGVREFDLLYAVPFGRAFGGPGDTLLLDHGALRPHLRRALDYARGAGLHLWLERFPPPLLEGHEDLIGDPHKLLDEVRGRRAEFTRRLEQGEALDCRQPARCEHCVLATFCDALERTIAEVAAGDFDRVRVDVAQPAAEPPPDALAGDPASAKYLAVSRAAREKRDGIVSLGAVPQLDLAQLSAPTLHLLAPDLPAALEALAARAGRFDAAVLELARYDGLAAALDAGLPGGVRLAGAVTADPRVAERLLAVPAAFEVVVVLCKATAPWLEGLAQVSERLALRQPTHATLGAALEHEVDLRAFFEAFRHPVPLEGVPACISGRPPRQPVHTVETAIFTAAGRLEVFAFARRQLEAHLMTRSLRCATCRHEPSCAGLHLNTVRAQGFGLMQPEPGDPAVPPAEPEGG